VPKFPRRPLRKTFSTDSSLTSSFGFNPKSNLAGVKLCLQGPFGIKNIPHRRQKAVKSRVKSRSLANFK
jgi:hypothetical protein